MINYRMDFVTGAKPPKAPPGKKAYKPLAESFTRGTLEEILEVGGICMDQSHFGTTAARAYGIPAASVGGDGNRGGHAWFAYLMPNHQWNMGNGFRPFNEPRNLPGTGRYADGYANGHTRDPQTGRGIGEFEVQLTGDPKRRMKSHYEKAFSPAPRGPRLRRQHRPGGALRLPALRHPRRRAVHRRLEGGRRLPRGPRAQGRPRALARFPARHARGVQRVRRGQALARHARESPTATRRSMSGPTRR